MLYDNGPLQPPPRPGVPSPSDFTPSGNAYDGPMNAAGRSIKTPPAFNLKNPAGNTLSSPQPKPMYQTPSYPQQGYQPRPIGPYPMYSQGRAPRLLRNKRSMESGTSGTQQTGRYGSPYPTAPPWSRQQYPEPSGPRYPMSPGIYSPGQYQPQFTPAVPY